jgi:hypothetical protein
MKIGIGLGIGYNTFKKKGGPSPAVISADFTSRVIANGGSLTTTEQNAILALVTNLVNNGLWGKMKLIYPMVGGTAASCAVNLVDSNYLATFSSGWTFTSTGGAPTGANTFMRAIGFNPSLVLPTNDTCFSYYSRTSNGFNGTDLGCQLTTGDTKRVALSLNFGGLTYADLNDFTNGRIGASPSGTAGLFLMSRESSTLMKMYKNSFQLGTTNTASMTSLLPNAIYSVGTLDFNDGINFSSTNRECAFSHVSTSLTSVDALTFYNNVQTFQTSLSRQV